MFRESFDADKERSEELAVQRVYDQIVLSLKSKETLFFKEIQEILVKGSSIQAAIQKIVYPYIQKTDIYQKTISTPATLDEAISRYEDMIAEKVQNFKNTEDDVNLHTDLDLKDIFTDEGRILTSKESEKFDVYTKSHLLKNLDDHPIQLPSKSEVSPQQRNDLKTIVTDLKEMIPNKHLDYRNILLDFFKETSDFQNISVEDMDTIVENITKKYHIYGEENVIHLKDCLIRAKKILQKT